MGIQAANLVSYENLVQAPFIIVTIGGHTFGAANKSGGTNSYTVEYPNFMTSIQITKINGTLNVYKITMEYGITQYDDPNLLESVFGSVSDTREITITYGDWNMPSYIYKEEKALITKVTTDVSFSSSKITYTVDCTSTAVSLTSSVYNFPAVTDTKGSDVIKNVVANKSYGVTDVFTGMSLESNVIKGNMIESDDKAVNIPAQARTSIIDYFDCVTKYMTSYADANSVLKNDVYTWSVCDDYNNEYGGPYFKVGKMTSNIETTKSGNTFEVDVGYPGPNFVQDFKIKQDNSWSILYKFSEKTDMSQYSYGINDDGKLVSTYSPVIMNGKYSGVTEADKTWWTNMVKFPIQATLTIKGLLRPAMLMTYIKVNSYFYGREHISSGTYFITKQVDRFDSSGYTTTLNLTRMSE